MSTRKIVEDKEKNKPVITIQKTIQKKLCDMLTEDFIGSISNGISCNYDQGYIEKEEHDDLLSKIRKIDDVCSKIRRT